MSKALYKEHLKTELEMLQTQHQQAMSNFNQSQKIFDQCRVVAIKLEGQMEHIQNQLSAIETNPELQFKFLKDETKK